MKYTEKLDHLIDQLSKLPSIGKKSAERLAFFLLKKDLGFSEDLADSIVDARKSIKKCSECNNYTEDDLCSICSNEYRDRTRMCIVENIKDLIVIESTNQFSGIYHVLGGVISPLDGIGPTQLNLFNLAKRVKENHVKEIIIAINPKIEGETTISYIKELLKDFNVELSKLAYGIPIGGEIEYTNSSTIAKSLENRISI